jgi:hypothetical protein
MTSSRCALAQDASQDPRACVTGCHQHAAPSRDLAGAEGLTRRPEPARPLRFVSRSAARRCGSHLRDHFTAFPARLSRETGEAPLREHGDRRRTRSAGRGFGGACFRSARRSAPNEAAQTARPGARGWRSGYASRSCEAGPPLGPCASTGRLPPRRCLTPSVSVRFTSLRGAAANEPLRWLAALLRSVPLPEAGGDRRGEVCTLRVSCSMRTGRDRDPAGLTTLRSARWHEGTANATVLARPSLRACALALLPLRDTQHILCVRCARSSLRK